MDPQRIQRSTGKTRTYEPTPSADQLVGRCRTLMAELVSFEDFVATRKCKAADIRHFKGSVQSEERSLLRLSEADQEASQTTHNLRSSNLPFYEAVWNTARSSRAIVALQKKFHWDYASRKPAKGKQKKKCAIVDIVAEDGLQWIKVSTVTESKLLFEKAKVGWEAEEFADSSDDGLVGKKVLANGAEAPVPEDADSEDENEGEMELIRVARDLIKASSATRTHFKHPSVIMVLPNITEGSNAAVDAILLDIRGTGASLRCGQQPQGSSTSGQRAPPFESMLPSSTPLLSSTVNLDCTVLLALVSDLSHESVDKLVLPEKPHPSLLYQVDIERATPLLSSILYPGLAKADRLVTSARSAARMWDIVRVIGTATEHERAHWLLGNSPHGEKLDSATLHRRLQQLSTHIIPPLSLPVIVIEDGINTTTGIPTKVIGRVSGQLSDINRSVFIMGWTNGWTTVTSNQTAVKTIEATVIDELNRNEADQAAIDTFDGPKIWTIDVARSLVGKESGRAQ